MGYLVKQELSDGTSFSKRYDHEPTPAEISSDVQRHISMRAGAAQKASIASNPDIPRAEETSGLPSVGAVDLVQKALHYLGAPGRAIDKGLGKVATHVSGSPMDAPISEQAVAAFVPHGANETTLLDRIAVVPGIISETGRLSPKAQAYEEAVARPIVRTGSQLAVDPVAYGALGAIPKAQAVLGPLFAASMAKGTLEAGRESKRIRDEEGWSPNAVEAFVETALNAGLASQAAKGSAKEIGGRIRNRAVPKEGTVAAEAPTAPALKEGEFFVPFSQAEQVSGRTGGGKGSKLVGIGKRMLASAGGKKLAAALPAAATAAGLGGHIAAYEVAHLGVNKLADILSRSEQSPQQGSAPQNVSIGLPGGQQVKAKVWVKDGQIHFETEKTEMVGRVGIGPDGKPGMVFSQPAAVTVPRSTSGTSIESAEVPSIQMDAEGRPIVRLNAPQQMEVPSRSTTSTAPENAQIPSVRLDEQGRPIVRMEAPRGQAEEGLTPDVLADVEAMLKSGFASDREQAIRLAQANQAARFGTQPSKSQAPPQPESVVPSEAAKQETAAALARAKSQPGMGGEAPVSSPAPEVSDRGILDQIPPEIRSSIEKATGIEPQSEVQAPTEMQQPDLSNIASLMQQAIQQAQAAKAKPKPKRVVLTPVERSIQVETRPVDSMGIKSMGYNAQAKTLEVTRVDRNGRESTYQYHDFPKSHWDRIQKIEGTKQGNSDVSVATLVNRLTTKWDKVTKIKNATPEQPAAEAAPEQPTELESNLQAMAQMIQEGKNPLEPQATETPASASVPTYKPGDHLPDGRWVIEVDEAGRPNVVSKNPPRG